MKIKKRALLDAGIPLQMIQKNLKKLAPVVSENKMTALVGEYGLTRTTELAGIATVAVAKGMNTRFVTEAALLDVYAGTFDRNDGPWADLMKTEFVVMDGMDGVNARRNLYPGIFTFVENRVMSDLGFVFGLSLDFNEIKDLYGDVLCSIIRRARRLRSGSLALIE